MNQALFFTLLLSNCFVKSSADDNFSLCFQHFISAPESAINYDTRLSEKLQDDSTTQLINKQKTLIQKHLIDLKKVPQGTEECSWLFCRRCKQTVRKSFESVFYDPLFILDETYYKCGCLRKWSTEEDLEEDSSVFLEDDDNSLDPITDWLSCKKKAIPSYLLNIDSEDQAKGLSEQFYYYDSNTLCSCFWNHINKNAYQINHDLTLQFSELLVNTFLVYNDSLPEIKTKFSHFDDLSFYGIASHELSHLGFYSQIRCKLLSWALLDEFYNSDLEKVKQNLDRFYQLIDQAANGFQTLYSHCINKHPHPKIYYERGLLNFHQGKYFTALSDISNYIKSSPEDAENFIASMYYKAGEIYSELGHYEQAISSLSKAINLDPANNELYLERASSYFQLGLFDQALEDYLKSDIKPLFDKSPSVENKEFWNGLTIGIKEGSLTAGVNFLPNLWTCGVGLSKGLFAFSKDPIDVSYEFIVTMKDLILFIKENSGVELFQKLIPELKPLIEQWDHLDHKSRGEMSGAILGQYGVEVFSGAGLSKATTLYNRLKRMNNLLVFESMVLKKESKRFIKLEALKKAEARKKVLKSSNLNIEWDKQGKHLVHHRNYEKTKSILEHKDPQYLINKYAGSGIRKTSAPGKAGYKEFVNFNEFIGYAVEPVTGKKIPTTWGTIHYSKTGTHLVPTPPRSIWLD